MRPLATPITVPDLWQQKAVNCLRAKHDVIVHAPTGAGKTLIFEAYIENGFSGKAVYTVPTRALANDKLREWQAKGWNVGITTGDVSYNTEAPIIVATLETQKRAVISGKGPSLLVVDEYQMLGDPTRGTTYEIAMAMAPLTTQLLLLSGSVANPKEIERWLSRCKRSVVSINHIQRPVPLEEIHLNALPSQIPQSIHGRWPRYIARALQADLGPILIFAPRRKVAETLARSLAAALPDTDPLHLSHEQKIIAGQELSRCLKNRVAFHHSGMSYAQRAGLVEPLAKNSQLKVIVATTGLAAGINFSMRSVLILEREYRVAEAHRMLRPDELLQMFGRAGRRGLDARGAALYIDNKPRLSEARSLKLKRDANLDWPSLLTIIQSAVEAGRNPLQATRQLTARLFSREPIRIGLEDFLKKRHSTAQSPKIAPMEQALAGGTITEFQNSSGIWERKRAPILYKLKDTWCLINNKWQPGLSTPKIVASIRIGTICKSGTGAERRYGIEAPIATFPRETNDNRLKLSKWLLKALRENERAGGKKPNIPKLWTLEQIEKTIIPTLPLLTRGGQSVSLNERNNTLYAQLDYSEAEIHAYKDLNGKGLLNPKIRKREIVGTEPATGDKTGNHPRAHVSHSVVEAWHSLGLIDEKARPTRRGIIFSFFNHGEGLAITAALEEQTYPIEEILYDLANIRAGHRFQAIALAGRPLAAICQSRYGLRNIPGYMRHGLPEDYGDGASEILYNIENKSSRATAYIDEDLSWGDIERARIEWRSLKAHIATAAQYDWDRWTELQQICRESLAKQPASLPFENLPPLTRQQKGFS